jgi:hypothetical protein
MTRLFALANNTPSRLGKRFFSRLFNSMAAFATRSTSTTRAGCGRQTSLTFPSISVRRGVRAASGPGRGAPTTILAFNDLDGDHRESRTAA